MNILLIGYGKMGKMIEEIAVSRNHIISHIIDNEYHWETLKDKNIAEEIDVAIDFSVPMLADYNIMECFNRDIPIVVGTTGWYNKLPFIRSYSIENNKSIFLASNFSIGMYIFNKINEELSSYMNNQPSYNVIIEETHHIQKLDAPSGSSITLAETIIDNIERKKEWVSILENDFKKEYDDDKLLIKSKRIGNITGDHSIEYNSEIDEIIISHRAHNRKGFALGAIMAAEFLKDKKGYYSMKDMIK